MIPDLSSSIVGVAGQNIPKEKTKDGFILKSTDYKQLAKWASYMQKKLPNSIPAASPIDFELLILLIILSIPSIWYQGTRECYSKREDSSPNVS